MVSSQSRRAFNNKSFDAIFDAHTPVTLHAAGLWYMAGMTT
ncbi:MAG: hypothetical protein WBR56_02965 [Sedimenticolaceae bacterium]